MSDNVLEYETQTVPQPFPWRRCLLFALRFASVAGPVAAIVWWRADWWTYRHGLDGEPLPEFKLPLWFQIGASAAVGALASAGILGAALVLRRLTRGKRRRGAGSTDQH